MGTAASSPSSWSILGGAYDTKRLAHDRTQNLHPRSFANNRPAILRRALSFIIAIPNQTVLNAARSSSSHFTPRFVTLNHEASLLSYVLLSVVSGATEVLNYNITAHFIASSIPFLAAKLCSVLPTFYDLFSRS